MKTLTRTRSIGGSLLVTIPKEIVREEGLKAGELIEIDVNRPKRTFFGVASGIGSFRKEDELKAHD